MSIFKVTDKPIVFKNVYNKMHGAKFTRWKVSPGPHTYTLHKWCYKSYWCLTVNFLFRRDKYCGTIFCTGGNKYPITGLKAQLRTINGDICNIAGERSLEWNLSMVPTGAKCGQNKVSMPECWNCATFLVHCKSIKLFIFTVIHCQWRSPVSYCKFTVNICKRFV